MTSSGKSISWKKQREICCPLRKFVPNSWSIATHYCGSVQADTSFSRPPSQEHRQMWRSFSCGKLNTCSRPRWPMILWCWAFCHNWPRINFSSKIRLVRFRSIWAKFNIIAVSFAKEALYWSREITRMVCWKHSVWDFHQLKQLQVVVLTLGHWIHGVDLQPLCSKTQLPYWRSNETILKRRLFFWLIVG